MSTAVMSPTSPRAFLLSAGLHTVIIVLALLVGYATSEGTKERPTILELVAGEGDNYMAREAPALGTEGGVKLNLPKAPEPKPAPPEPVKAEPTPITPAPPTPKAVAPKAVTPPPKEAEPTIPDFKKKIRRDLIVAESKAKREIARERAAEAKRLAEEKKRMSKEEFDRANKAANTPAAKTPSTKVAKIDSEGIAKGVLGGSTANKIGGASGKAMTSDNTDVLAAYFRMFKDRLREKFEPPPGLSDSLRVTVEVRSNADGTFSGARVVKSSGSAEYDRSVLDAIKQVKMPARPDHKSDTIEFIFSMRDRGEG